MAEFGVQATSLQDPRGAGSAPPSPVQEPGQVFPNVAPIGGLFDGLAKLAQKPWTGTVSDYTKEITNIQQAVQSGELTARAGLTRMNQTTTKYQAQGAGFGPEYTKAIGDTWQHLQYGTGISDVQATVQDERKNQQDMLQEAQKLGLFKEVQSYDQLDDKSKNALLNYVAAEKNANYIFDKQVKQTQFQNSQNAEKRAAITFEHTTNDYARTQEARNAVGSLMFGSIDVVDAVVNNVFNNNALSPEQKALSLSGQLSQVRAKAFEVLKGDQAALDSYNRNLDNLEKLAIQRMDPKTASENVVAEYNRQLAQFKMNVISDPKGGQLAAYASIFPNNVGQNMAINQYVIQALNRDKESASKNRPLSSVATNDIEGQKMTFKAMTDTIRRSMDGSSIDPSQDLGQAASMAQSAIKSMSTFTPGTQNTMEYLKDFIASPEYGELVRKGMINQQDSRAAAQVFNDIYLPPFAENVRNVLTQPVGDPRYENGVPAPDNATLMRLIDFEVGSDGTVSIVKKIDPETRKKIVGSDMYIDRLVRQAKSSLERPLNNALRANAHMEGRTDYKQYFEQNAPYILRGFYPPAGQVETLKSQGYIGTGNVNNPSNWRKNGGADANQPN